MRHGGGGFHLQGFVSFPHQQLTPDPGCTLSVTLTSERLLDPHIFFSKMSLSESKDGSVQTSHGGLQAF